MWWLAMPPHLFCGLDVTLGRQLSMSLNDTQLKLISPK